MAGAQTFYVILKIFRLPTLKITSFFERKVKVNFRPHPRNRTNRGMYRQYRRSFRHEMSSSSLRGRRQSTPSAPEPRDSSLPLRRLEKDFNTPFSMQKSLPAKH